MCVLDRAALTMAQGPQISFLRVAADNDKRQNVGYPREVVIHNAQFITIRYCTTEQPTQQSNPVLHTPGFASPLSSIHRK